MHMRNGFRFITSIVIAFALLACGEKAQSAGSVTTPASAAENQTASTTQVRIDNFSFTPQTLTIDAGTTVTWTNNDDVPHNVVSTDKVFKSKTMDTDEKFSYTFTKSGTYNYYCSIHPRMTASVIVK